MSYIKGNLYLMIDGKIYKITNLINGNVYIGQTIMSISRRWQAHCSGRDSSMKISRAIKKYGAESFIIELIDTADNLDDLNRKEAEFISLLKTDNEKFGYNILSGGLNRRLTQDMKNKISKSNTGKIKTPEMRRKASLAAKKTWSTPGFKLKMSQKKILQWKDPIFRAKHAESMDKINTEEFRASAGIRSKNRWLDPVYREKLIHKMKDIGNKESFKETMRSVNTKISMERYSRKFAVYKAIMTEAGGWQTAKKYKKGDFIGFWTHKKTCAKDLNINCSGISQALGGILKQSNNYIFEYVE